jgi:hypothetical protein
MSRGRTRKKGQHTKARRHKGREGRDCFVGQSPPRNDNADYDNDDDNEKEASHGGMEAQRAQRELSREGR